MKKRCIDFLSKIHQTQTEDATQVLMPYELEWFELTGNEIDFRQVMIELHEEVKLLRYAHDLKDQY